MNTELMDSEARVLCFKCICNFIKDLNDSFGESQKSLYLYAALMDRTGIMHEDPIKKHISLFYKFIKDNEEGIINENWKLFKYYELQYSEKVGFDLKPIFEICDKDESLAIYKHLLTLLAVLDPSSSAKEILKKEMKLKEKSGELPNEENFLKDMIDTVNSQMDPNIENPLQLMNKMMSSGVFSNLVEKMNSSIADGNLDLGKMVNTVQKVMTDLSSSIPTSK